MRVTGMLSVHITSALILENLFQEKERIEKIQKDSLSREWELAMERCKGGAIPKTGQFKGMNKK